MGQCSDFFPTLGAVNTKLFMEFLDHSGQQ
jgi:hypothetical protein